MIKKFNYLIQSILIYLFFLLGRIVGLRISRKIFSKLFSSIGPLFKSKKTIYNNLETFSSQISDHEKKQISNNMWKNYGMTFIEYIFLDYFKKNNSHIEIIDKCDLSQITNEKKPVIFVSGHFANFELMSMEITKKKIPLATIYRPLNNFFLNPFMEYLRKEYVCSNQIKKGFEGVRKSIKFLDNNFCIALMIDQRVSEGERINFFGRPALTTTMPAQLSMKFDIDIIPVFIERNEENKFKIEFQERINPKRYKDKLELTKKLNNVLEKMILKNPSQWIWTHNRWK